MSKKKTLVTSFVLTVLLAGCRTEQPKPDPTAAPPETGASWPRFHGANGDNISTETGLLSKWPRGGPTAWPRTCRR